MKNLMLYITISMFLCNCNEYHIPNIQYSGSAKSFSEKYLNPVMHNVCEASLINEGWFISNFYDLTFHGNLDYSLTFDNHTFIGNKRLKKGGHRFSYVIKHDNIYYYAYTDGVVSMNMYLARSVGGDDWTVLNNGRPIIKKSIDINSKWFNMWNPSFSIDENNNIHFYIETQVKAPGQTKTGIAYATGNLDDENNIQMETREYFLIEHAGNPWIMYKNNKVYIIYGSLDRGFWSIKAGTIENYEDFYPVDFEIYESNIHIADPHMVRTPDNQLMIVFSYDQRDLFSIYSSETIEDIFK